MADRIQFRRDTSARWQEVNPILAEGEIGLVTDDPNLYKIGDGTNNWNNLAYRGFNGTVSTEYGDYDSAVPSLQMFSKSVTNYNVSFHYPNDGIDGTNEYTLETAIEKIPTYLRKHGIICSFINNSNGTCDSWIFQGGEFTALNRWVPLTHLGSNTVLIKTNLNDEVLDTIKEPGIFFLTTSGFKYFGLLKVYYSGFSRKSILQEYSGKFGINDGLISDGGQSIKTAYRIFNISDSNILEEIPYNTWGKWKYYNNLTELKTSIYDMLKSDIVIPFDFLFEGSIDNEGSISYNKTGFINVDENTRISFCVRVKGDYFIKFYDSEKIFLSGYRTTGSEVETREMVAIAPPKGASFAQLQTMNKYNSSYEEYNYYINVYNVSDKLNIAELYIGEGDYEIPYNALETNVLTGNSNYYNTPMLSLVNNEYIDVSLRTKGDTIGEWYDKNKESIGKIKSGYTGQNYGNVIKRLIPPKNARYVKFLTMNSTHPNYEEYNYYIKIHNISSVINKLNEIITDNYNIDNYNWNDGIIGSNSDIYKISEYIPIEELTQKVKLSVRMKGGTYLEFYDSNNVAIKSYSSHTGNAENIIGEYIAPLGATSFRVVTMKDNHSEYEEYNFYLKISFSKVGMPSPTFSPLPSLELWAAQEINFNDGSDPISKNYLFSTNGNDFYIARNKYGDNLQYIFTWDSTLQESTPYNYSAAILSNGDILFIYKSEAVSGSTASDNWQKNPIIYEKNNNYKPYIIDFGDAVKPGGWLQNVGFNAIYPYDCIIFGEYTRASAEKARIWKVNYPYNNVNNWKIKKEFDVSYDTSVPNCIKHIHTIQFDQFTGYIYACTGDEYEGSNIWISKDEGENWEFVYGPSEKYCRLLNFIFTEDYVYWATDSPTDRLHYLFKAQRNEDGVINVGDAEELTQLTQPESGMLLATYGLSYIKQLNVLLLLERVDGGGWEWMPIRMWDLTTNQLKIIGRLESVSGGKQNIGFRCTYLELYPKDTSVMCGYNNFSSYRNRIKILGNIDSSQSDTRINNILLRLGYSNNNFNLTFDTIYK